MFVQATRTYTKYHFMHHSLNTLCNYIFGLLLVIFHFLSHSYFHSSFCEWIKTIQNAIIQLSASADRISRYTKNIRIVHHYSYILNRIVQWSSKYYILVVTWYGTVKTVFTYHGKLIVRPHLAQKISWNVKSLLFFVSNTFSVM